MCHASCHVSQCPLSSEQQPRAHYVIAGIKGAMWAGTQVPNRELCPDTDSPGRRHPTRAWSSSGLGTTGTALNAFQHHRPNQTLTHTWVVRPMKRDRHTKCPGWRPNRGGTWARASSVSWVCFQFHLLTVTSPWQDTGTHWDPISTRWSRPAPQF